MITVLRYGAARVGHMTAPDQCCNNVKKALVNQAPSTHDPKRAKARVKFRIATDWRPIAYAHGRTFANGLTTSRAQSMNSLSPGLLSDFSMS
jgi:hypothetical protein